MTKRDGRASFSRTVPDFLVVRRQKSKYLEEKSALPPLCAFESGLKPPQRICPVEGNGDGGLIIQSSLSPLRFFSSLSFIFDSCRPSYLALLSVVDISLSIIPIAGGK